MRFRRRADRGVGHQCLAGGSCRSGQGRSSPGLRGRDPAASARHRINVIGRSRRRLRQQANLARARAAVDDYLTTISESRLLKSPLARPPASSQGVAGHGTEILRGLREPESGRPRPASRTGRGPVSRRRDHRADRLEEKRRMKHFRRRLASTSRSQEGPLDPRPGLTAPAKVAASSGWQ